MPKAIRIYVRYVDAVSYAVGRFAMYLIFAMMGVLLYSSISRTAFNMPLIWVVEIAQFTMAAYYLLGGGYSMLIDSHVRVDLFYGRWPIKKTCIHRFHHGFLPYFLSDISTYRWPFQYSICAGIWPEELLLLGPPLAPIKIIMTFGILLMLLQAISMFFKDWGHL